MRKSKLAISTLFLSFSLLFNGFSVMAEQMKPIVDNYIIGDINGDGYINSNDYGMLKLYLLGFIKDFSYKYGFQAADVNIDGNVNSIDFGIFKRYLLGMITDFPQTPIPTPFATPKPPVTQAEGYEIERKFLIDPNKIPYDLDVLDKYEITQSYISFSPEIRLRNVDGTRFYLTVKANVDSNGLIREERNFWMTEEEYNNLFKKIEGNVIYKARYQGLDEHRRIFAIDIFKGDLEGLAYYEMEFPNEELANSYIPPSWVGKEVTSDKRYKNGSLAQFGIPKD
ncbi:dockerin type I domain-containing protein [Acetivibrio clariflavus]|uniref:dockerin type I domain-containing protein n=1 Tax=Acetivibrio clariflavus TaxID=288965 RepID=UPI0004B6332D|nr:dockerin type I domain-containing protein [Acetivibrio clariflavus]